MIAGVLGLGRYDEALEDVKKAVDGGYRNIYSYMNLAAAHAFKGEMDEAKAAWRRRVDSSPTYPSGRETQAGAADPPRGVSRRDTLSALQRPSGSCSLEDLSLRGLIGRTRP